MSDLKIDDEQYRIINDKNIKLDETVMKLTDFKIKKQIRTIINQEKDEIYYIEIEEDNIIHALCNKDGKIKEAVFDKLGVKRYYISENNISYISISVDEIKKNAIIVSYNDSYKLYINITSEYCRIQLYLYDKNLYFDMLIKVDSINNYTNNANSKIVFDINKYYENNKKLLKFTKWEHNHSFTKVWMSLPTFNDLFKLNKFLDEDHIFKKMYKDDSFKIAPSNLIIKNKDDKNNPFICKVCLIKSVSYMYKKCKHLCLCEECKDNSGDRCPICRQVSSIDKIFI